MIKASGESRLETGKARLPPSLKTLSLNHNAHCFVYAILDTNLEDVAIAVPMNMARMACGGCYRILCKKQAIVRYLFLHFSSSRIGAPAIGVKYRFRAQKS